MQLRPQNFTKISDQKLLFKDHLIVLGYLTFYRVLTTDELFQISKYRYGIKSFRKLLQKFIKEDLIAYQLDEINRKRLLYPTVKTLRFYKKDYFQNYQMVSTDLGVLNSYHALFHLIKNLKTFESYQKEQSYINDPFVTFDHCLIFDMGFPQRIGFFLFFEENEVEIFSRIKRAFDEHLIEKVIILTNESDYLMQNMITHYLSELHRKTQRMHWYRVMSATDQPLKRIKEQKLIQTTFKELFHGN